MYCISLTVQIEVMFPGCSQRLKQTTNLQLADRETAASFVSFPVLLLAILTHSSLFLLHLHVSDGCLCLRSKEGILFDF
jgi:hypothetical protein